MSHYPPVRKPLSYIAIFCPKVGDEDLRPPSARPSRSRHRVSPRLLALSIWRSRKVTAGAVEGEPVHAGTPARRGRCDYPESLQFLTSGPAHSSTKWRAIHRRAAKVTVFSRASCGLRWGRHGGAFRSATPAPPPRPPPRSPPSPRARAGIASPRLARR